MIKSYFLIFAFCPFAARLRLWILCGSYFFWSKTSSSQSGITTEAYRTVSFSSSVIPFTPRLVFFSSLTSFSGKPRESPFFVINTTLASGLIASATFSGVIPAILSSLSILVVAMTERLVSKEIPATCLTKPFLVAKKSCDSKGLQRKYIK